MFFCIACPVFSKKSSIDYERLDGEWELYLHKSPQQVFEGAEKDCMISVPGFWNKAVETYLGSTDPKTYGCYRYVVKGLNPSEKQGLLIKDSPGTSCAVFVNGKRIAQNGDPFFTLLDDEVQKKLKHKSHSQNRPILGYFYPDTYGQAEIVIFITNYFYRKSGLWDSVMIGPARNILRINTILLTFYTVVSGILIFIGLMNIIQFLINKKQKEYILLGLTAITFALRVSTAGYCSLGIIIPTLTYELKIKLEYMVMWVCSICIMSQLYILYPAKKDYIIFKWLKEKVLRTICVIPSLLCGIVSLILPAVHANKMVPILQGFLGVIALYVIIKIIIEIVRKSRYIHFYLLSCSSLILGAIVDVLYTTTRTFVPMSLFPIFLVVFIFIQLFLLAVYQNDIYKTTIRISSDLQKLNEAYLRFVPKEFLNLLNKDSITNIELGDYSRIEMSIIFSKISIEFNNPEGAGDNSAFDPEMHFKIFNEYLSRISPVIKNHNGFVSKFLSGGFMALFPESQKDSLEASLDIVKIANELNAVYKNKGYVLIPRIGVHFGKMIIGTIGEKNRMDDTVISDTVNTVSRIESVCERLNKNIILSHSLYEIIDPSEFESIELESLESIYVKGKEKPLQLYACSRKEDL